PGAQAPPCWEGPHAAGAWRKITSGGGTMTRMRLAGTQTGSGASQAGVSQDAVDVAVAVAAATGWAFTALVGIGRRVASSARAGSAASRAGRTRGTSC